MKISPTMKDQRGEIVEDRVDRHRLETLDDDDFDWGNNEGTNCLCRIAGKADHGVAPKQDLSRHERNLDYSCCRVSGTI